MNTIKRHKIILTVLSALLTALVILFGCEDTPNGPEEPPPGSRDYTWKVDTVNVPFNYLSRMWGSSPTDIWAVGSGGGLDQTIWHYDGNEWKTDGISRPIAPVSVYGFASNDVWIAGMEGKIFQYDGIEWTEKLNFENPGSFGLYAFMDIWGESPNEIYAVGFIDSLERRKAMMFEYDDSDWKRIGLPKNNYTLLRILKSKLDKEFYIMSWIEHQFDNDSSLLIHYKSNELKLLHEDILDRDSRNFILRVQENVYAVIGSTLYQLDEGKLKKVFTVDNPEFGLQMFGRNENDIFLRMEDGIAHYNGNDMRYLQRFDTRQSVMDEAIFENEVFFLVIDFERDYNLIYHGTLND
jgi:hypothetical protein